MAVSGSAARLTAFASAACTTVGARAGFTAITSHATRAARTAAAASRAATRCATTRCATTRCATTSGGLPTFASLRAAIATGTTGTARTGYFVRWNVGTVDIRDQRATRRGKERGRGGDKQCTNKTHNTDPVSLSPTFWSKGLRQCKG
jgi:hypothetical protein